MCVNDLLASGGEPLIFLDYISSSNINKEFFLKIIKSITLACRKSNCSLVGGETAEMPGMYKKNDFDIAGFALGVVERKDLIKKDNIKNNSLILGLESNGFHSNGFSLIRKVINVTKIKYNDRPPYRSFEKNFGDDLLLPTRIYVNQILPLIKKNLLLSISHITGGGIFENLSRIIPERHQAIIDFKKFSIPECFLWVSKVGRISSLEMLNTFNCGIGMILIINANNKDKIVNFFSKNKIKCHIMGKITAATPNQKKVLVKNFGIWDLT